MSKKINFFKFYNEVFKGRGLNDPFRQEGNQHQIQRQQRLKLCYGRN